MLAAIRARDHNDMTRAASPLVRAADAEEIEKKFAEAGAKVELK